MTGRMVERLLRLTGRERLLLGVMALVLLLGAGVGLLWPLAERRAASAAALEEARALSAWVAARAEDARVLRSAAGPGPAEPIGLAAVQRSLEGAGLSGNVATLSARQGGGIEMRFEAVSFDLLIGWLTQVEPVWGYRFAGFRLDRGAEPGLVDARIEVVP
ncbi:type II secretion system protein M [Mameliella sp. CS4]|uniref:type II secretion system protein GspM n=1 Tax=Mameliella sp. CS4 TaxID=2862329 RepID=UPI001C60776B|nr:type II secretion system protein GspM [Mameliella sp. CS4]MBW4982876.1 type II secretion system protein M [Mameliella sp. CS4]